MVLVIFLGIGLTLDPKEVPSPLIDKAAPAFDLPRLYDDTARISVEDMKGKVWLLNVFASWCVSCRAEHRIITDFANSGLADVVGLNYKDAEADAKIWLARLGNPYSAIAVDAEGRVGIDWGVYGVPETFVMDKKGIIRYKNIGPVTVQSLNETIRPLVERLLKEPN
jgi:cytochrome c biogenesis protein CcmG/thiol:disulfide interchange protein DsbE